MKRKCLDLGVFAFIAAMGLFYFNKIFAIIWVLGCLLLISVMIGFLILNSLVKKTNWWNNKFCYTKKFCSNLGYRTYWVRNLEVVNVGSNPALFAFNYENILGENWSSGTQGLNMDFEILKYRHSFLKEGAYVLIPFVLFSSVSEYLNTKPGHRSVDYYLKYLRIIDYRQISKLPCGKDIFRYARYPLLYNLRSLKYLIKDVEPNRLLDITSQTMSLTEMQYDADMFISGWKREFDIKSLKQPLNKALQDAMKDTAKIVSDMIDFLEERNYKPVFVFPPMSESLYEKIPSQTLQCYVYDFINLINKPEVPFLDYCRKEELRENKYYFNSLFMNLEGRRVFTKKILEDLKLK